MTNILITGATGFIGSHLAHHLAKDKNNIIYGLTRSIKHESVFNALSLDSVSNINLICGSVNDCHEYVNNYNIIEEILYKHDIDQVYHLAAQAIVQTASKCPVPTITTNVFGTLNVLEPIRSVIYTMDKEIPTFVMSTDKSYGISENLPYTEDLPLNGLDIYSASKACEDILARSYAYNYNLPIVVGRPANTYGLDFNWTRLIPSLAKSCLYCKEKDNPIILNKGSYHYIREYNYVEDTVSAIELLMKNIDKTKGEAYNISSGHKHTTEEIVKYFLEMCHCNKIIEFKKKDIVFKEIPEQYLDSSKLINATGWKPKYNIYYGLGKTCANYKKWFDKEV
jgi:CDP-glucose 4,6-dehydratase